jgi:ABC-2 type transport system permease protein
MLFSGLLAGEEGEGTLQSMLAQPVTRLRLFVEKVLAGMVISFVVCLGAAAGVLLALTLLHEQISLGRLLEATVGAWLLLMVFGSFSFGIGAITGKRQVAGGMTAMAAFGTYLLTSLASNVASLSTVEKLSPFHYYNTPAITVYGLAKNNVLVMVSVIIFFLVVSAIVFQRRDIYQK